MLQLPFDIPKSLVSYAEHFQKEPERATQRLKKQLEKRGPDAVGYFLLAWFYHLQDMPEEAIEKALKARIFSPGSPFLRKLHYYLQHPDLFKAWTPNPADGSSSTSSSTLDRHGPILNLDTLIQRLSEMESQRIQPNTEPLEDSGSTPSSGDVDDIASETLAKIHEQQGKIGEAIRSYERLKKAKPEKKEHYQEQVVRLENLKKQSEEE